MNSWPLILIAYHSSEEVQLIAELLNSEYRIKVAHNGTDALAVAQRNPLPDLVLLDVVLDDMDGFEVCRRLKQSPISRDIPVIFISSINDETLEALALDLQAADYIAKPFSMVAARARIRNKLKQSRSADMPAPQLADLPPLPLGKRQTEILTLIGEGLTSAEIGTQLSIAKGTVEVHREKIMRKLGVRNIAGLVKCAIRHGLLEP
jgi:DNA-binding NarL/FixJ family response regulator